MAKTYSSRKSKGSSFEREIAKLYVEYCKDKNAMRQPLSGAVDNLKGDINHLHNTAIPYKFIDECKNQESINIHKWWEQTLKQCGYGEEPVLHFKRNHKKPLTIINTETFFGLLSQIIELSNQIEEIKNPDVTPKKDWDKIEGQNKIKAGVNLIKQGLNKMDKD